MCVSPVGRIHEMADKELVREYHEAMYLHMGMSHSLPEDVMMRSRHENLRASDTASSISDQVG